MTENLVKIYHFLDGTFWKQDGDTLFRFSNLTQRIQLVAPFSPDNPVIINFRLENGLVVPERPLILTGTEDVIINEEEETWNVWDYLIPSAIVAGAASQSSTTLGVSFGVFELINEEQKLIKNTAQVNLSVNPNVEGIEEAVDATTTDIILQNLADNNASILNLEAEQIKKLYSEFRTYLVSPILLPDDVFIINGSTFTFRGSFSTLVALETAIPIGNINDYAEVLDEDQIYIWNSLTGQWNGTGQNKADFEETIPQRIPNQTTLAGLTEFFVGNNKGVFETLTDLLDLYPNGITNPGSRSGWKATVLDAEGNGTDNKGWAWDVAANAWFNTEIASTVTLDAFIALTARVTALELDTEKLENKTQDIALDTGSAVKYPSVAAVEGHTEQFALDTELAQETAERVAGDLGLQTQIDAKMPLDINTLATAAVILNDIDTFAVTTLSGTQRVTFDSLAAELQKISPNKGHFLTATGTGCPDIDDLICTYPNNISDPTVRAGWSATVGSTNTLWVWDVQGNQWVDTGDIGGGVSEQVFAVEKAFTQSERDRIEAEAQKLDEKNQPNGFSGLDSNGNIPSQNLPESVPITLYGNLDGGNNGILTLISPKSNVGTEVLENTSAVEVLLKSLSLTFTLDIDNVYQVGQVYDTAISFKQVATNRTYTPRIEYQLDKTPNAGAVIPIFNKTLDPFMANTTSHKIYLPSVPSEILANINVQAGDIQVYSIYIISDLASNIALNLYDGDSPTSLGLPPQNAQISAESIVTNVDGPQSQEEFNQDTFDRLGVIEPDVIDNTEQLPKKLGANEHEYKNLLDVRHINDSISYINNQGKVMGLPLKAQAVINNNAQLRKSTEFRQEDIAQSQDTLITFQINDTSPDFSISGNGLVVDSVLTSVDIGFGIRLNRVEETLGNMPATIVLYKNAVATATVFTVPETTYGLTDHTEVFEGVVCAQGDVFTLFLSTGLYTIVASRYEILEDSRFYISNPALPLDPLLPHENLAHSFLNLEEIELTDGDMSPTDFAANALTIMTALVAKAVSDQPIRLSMTFGSQYANLRDSIKAELNRVENNYNLDVELFRNKSVNVITVSNTFTSFTFTAQGTNLGDPFPVFDGVFFNIWRGAKPRTGKQFFESLAVLGLPSTATYQDIVDALPVETELQFVVSVGNTNLVGINGPPGADINGSLRCTKTTEGHVKIEWSNFTVSPNQPREYVRTAFPAGTYISDWHEIQLDLILFSRDVNENLFFVNSGTNVTNFTLAHDVAVGDIIEFEISSNTSFSLNVSRARITLMNDTVSGPNFQNSITAITIDASSSQICGCTVYLLNSNTLQFSNAYVQATVGSSIPAVIFVGEIRRVGRIG